MGLPMVAKKHRRETSSPESATILYCNFSAACYAAGNTNSCSFAAMRLAAAKITDVRIIRDPLPLLKEGGIEITGTPGELLRH